MIEIILEALAAVAAVVAAVIILFCICVILFIIGIILSTKGIKNRWQSSMSEKAFNRSCKIVRIVKRTSGLLCIIIIGITVVFGSALGILIKSNPVEKHVDRVVEEVSDAINSDSIKQKINEYVQEQLDEGIISEEQIQPYIENIESDPSVSLKREDGSTIAPGGAATPTQQPEATPAPTPAPTPKPASGGSGIDRVLAAMTPSDLAVTQNFMSRVDIGYLSSLASSDMAAAKAYIKQHFSGSEIAQGINIYSKYAYLLN